MRAIFFVPYPSAGPSNRYRIEQYLPFLQEKGIEYDVYPFWSAASFNILYKRGYFLKKVFYFILGSLFRVWNVLNICKYDVVVIHREIYPVFGCFFERIIYFFRKPLIFDFDDAIFLPSNSNLNSFMECFKRPGKISEIIRMSDYVIAGNRYLADFASKFNSDVCVIPTSIDIEKYAPRDIMVKDKVVIGWIGSVTTLDFVGTMKGVFLKLSKKYPQLVFKIIGGDFSIDGLSNIISKPWSAQDEVDELRSFDIGIMPMPDNEWTRGKCAFKAILYMSMAIPCVCSSVGVNKEIIADGINGFLGKNEDEWIQKLSLLIKDRQLREKIGVAGRRTIEEMYSVKVNAPIFLNVLEKAYHKTKKGRVEK